MSDNDIKTLVSELVEQKLEELLGDPDADRLPCRIIQEKQGR